MLSLTTTRDGLAARRTTASWLAPLCLALAAGLLYSINLGRLPQPDELHHAIAARGLLAVLHEELLRGIHMLSIAHVPPGAGMVYVTVRGVPSPGVSAVTNVASTLYPFGPVTRMSSLPKVAALRPLPPLMSVTMPPSRSQTAIQPPSVLLDAGFQ